MTGQKKKVSVSDTLALTSTDLTHRQKKKSISFEQKKRRRTLRNEKTLLPKINFSYKINVVILRFFLTRLQKFEKNDIFKIEKNCFAKRAFERITNNSRGGKNAHTQTQERKKTSFREKRRDQG